MARLCQLLLIFGFVAQAAALVHKPSSLSGIDAPDCGCVNWKDVYTLHNVTCGHALERYTYEWHRNDREDMKLFVDDNDTLWKRLNETERLIGICDNFYMRMNHNYAMNEHANLMEPTMLADRVWCYVKDVDGCDKANTEFATYSDGLLVKLFNDTQVPSFRQLPMQQILDIAKSDTLDLGMLLPAGAYSKLPGRKWYTENVTREDLEPYQKMRKPIVLEPRARKLARIFVYGHKMITFLPGWPWGAVPFKSDFKPTESPECPEEDCLEYDDYNEFCLRCEDDAIYEDPSFGDYSRHLYNTPKPEFVQASRALDEA
mmetsp:Transcript_17247/g.46796  ORF Transcript_17247/g.46796 Transcript_17247/m.46796 type:complete len:316 (-) Transcript_17247:57-1004(-)|eukprot:CAMPEP_0171183090 /NCGR_PEP_ID=MMETSP0790-20130122/15102_1 /TAXON_ID=2925 /ORGANISM="Alexandrium catenella, Strain OF101" /LENGTH=315 /DNA_ID=CAMNT_0011648061 /DNA_START=51 /DNA_END=998 /DNA_ORIENTATION=-